MLWFLPVPRGILVSDKQQSQDIEPFVDSMNQQVMFAEKSWGDFRVLDVEDGSLTVKNQSESGISDELSQP